MKVSHPSRLARRSAFTLMEMLLVLAIIGMLIGATTVGLKKAMNNAKVTTSAGKVGKMESSLQLFSSRHNGKLPSQAAGLRALVNEGIIDEEEIKDAWAQDMIYLNPSKRSKEKYDIFSKGTDGIEGNADDIGNWSSN